jgi:Cadherin cytoplasmic region
MLLLERESKCKLSKITVLVLVFVVYNRRREAHIKYPGPDDDVRENIINYDDEGGGEDDMTAFDITPLQIPIGAPDLAVPPKLPCECSLKITRVCNLLRSLVKRIAYSNNISY